MIGYYLTHPQVAIDPAVPVPRWSLSDKGRARLANLAGRPWLRTVARIVASHETKAQETAAILGAPLRLAVETGADMGENDRSSTGFLEPDAFEAAADRFFGAPAASWNGWERALDAQSRIAAAVEAVLSAHPAASPILFVGHGAVGTLLKCRLAARPIDRCEDQPAGGGNLFCFRLRDRALLRDWTPMEDFTEIADAA